MREKNKEKAPHKILEVVRSIKRGVSYAKGITRVK